MPRKSGVLSKRHWKSAVDDQFFSLAEMEEYLDRQEEDGIDKDENVFEQFDKVSIFLPLKK